MITKEDVDGFQSDSIDGEYAFKQFVPGELEIDVANLIIKTYGALTEYTIQTFWKDRLNSDSTPRVTG